MEFTTSGENRWLFGPSDGIIVEEWLRSLNLIEYLQAFIDNGYDDLEVCKQIGDEDLDAIGVEQLYHREILLSAVKTLKEQGGVRVYFNLDPEYQARKNISQALTDRNIHNNVLFSENNSLANKTVQENLTNKYEPRNYDDISCASQGVTVHEITQDVYQEGRQTLVTFPELQLISILRDKLCELNVDVSNLTKIKREEMISIHSLSKKFSTELHTHYNHVYDTLCLLAKNPSISFEKQLPDYKRSISPYHDIHLSSSSGYSLVPPPLPSCPPPSISFADHYGIHSSRKSASTSRIHHCRTPSPGSSSHIKDISDSLPEKEEKTKLSSLGRLFRNVGLRKSGKKYQYKPTVDDACMSPLLNDEDRTNSSIISGDTLPQDFHDKQCSRLKSNSQSKKPKSYLFNFQKLSTIWRKSPEQKLSYDSGDLDSIDSFNLSHQWISPLLLKNHPHHASSQVFANVSGIESPSSSRKNSFDQRPSFIHPSHSQLTSQYDLGSQLPQAELAMKYNNILYHRSLARLQGGKTHSRSYEEISTLKKYFLKTLTAPRKHISHDDIADASALTSHKAHYHSSTDLIKITKFKPPMNTCPHLKQYNCQNLSRSESGPDSLHNEKFDSNCESPDLGVEDPSPTGTMDSNTSEEYKEHKFGSSSTVSQSSDMSPSRDQHRTDGKHRLKNIGHIQYNSAGDDCFSSDYDEHDVSQKGSSIDGISNSPVFKDKCTCAEPITRVSSYHHYNIHPYNTTSFITHSPKHGKFKKSPKRSKPKTLVDLLTRIHLLHLYNVLCDNGFDTLELFADIEELDLDKLEITDPEDRAKIVTAAQMILDFEGSNHPYSEFNQYLKRDVTYIRHNSPRHKSPSSNVAVIVPTRNEKFSPPSEISSRNLENISQTLVIEENRNRSKEYPIDVDAIEIESGTAIQLVDNESQTIDNCMLPIIDNCEKAESLKALHQTLNRKDEHKSSSLLRSVDSSQVHLAPESKILTKNRKFSNLRDEV